MRVLHWINQRLLFRSKKNYLLTGIMVLAIVLRFIAVNPGFNLYHGDESAIVGGALKMLRKSSYDPGRYDYPATTMTINLLGYKLFFIPREWASYYLKNLGKVVDGTLSLFPIRLEKNKLFELYILGERAENATFWSRYITALFGVGTVFLTYLLGKKLFSREVGLLAALFLTFNYRNVVNSHLALPDIYNAFFVLLSLLASWGLIKKPTTLSYFLAGLSAGLSFSIKYQVFGIFPFVLAHLFLVFEKSFNMR